MTPDIQASTELERKTLLTIKFGLGSTSQEDPFCWPYSTERTEDGSLRACGVMWGMVCCDDPPQDVVPTWEEYIEWADKQIMEIKNDQIRSNTIKYDLM